VAEGAISYFVLGYKGGTNTVKLLEWAPERVSIRGARGEVTEQVGGWASDMEESLYNLRSQLPDGLFAAYVTLWCSQGMEDWDQGEHLLAVMPVETIAWRHTWGPLRTTHEERRYAADKELVAHMRAMEAQWDAEAAEINAAMGLDAPGGPPGTLFHPPG
jgi:hypothetical protein